MQQKGKEQNKLVSIIIPSHHASDTIKWAVDSALSQTYSPVEVIVVDDGTSGDLSFPGGKVDENKSLTVIQRKNEGVSTARNEGLKEAKGERIAFLDADDVLHPSFLAVLSNLLDETRADMAGCSFETRPQTKEPFSENSIAGKEDSSCSYTLLQGEEMILDGILSLHHPDTRVWSKLFERTLIDGHRFKEGLTIGEDMLFLTELVGEETKYAVSKEPLYSYAVNPDGAMERPFDVSYMDQLSCLCLVEEVIQKNFPKLLEEGNGALLLASRKLTSAVLTASKIAKLPSNEQKKYEAEFEECRAWIRKYDAVPGVEELLPSGYKTKIRLLLHAPLVYRKLYR